MLPRADDDPDCAGECNYVPRQVERRDAEGRVAIVEIEVCTGCGREIVPVTETAPAPVSSR